MSVRFPAGGPRWGRWLTTAAVIAAAVVLALVSCAIVSDGGKSSGGKPSVAGPSSAPDRPTPGKSAAGCTVSAILVPSCGVWFGVAANPLGDESWDEALPAFEAALGRTVDIAHYYNASPKLFPTAEMIKRAREPGKKRILLLNWKPEMGRTWAQVAAGDPEVDQAIDAEAQYLKTTFPEKFFLTIHHEPEEEVVPAPGSGYTAKDYAAMYRHVVERLRSQGVTNAITVMNYMGTPHWGSQPWFEDLYPGDDVVDWIAEDPYIFGSDPEWATGLGRAIDRVQKSYPAWPGFYTWASKRHPDKPIMLGEWGVDRHLGETKRKAVFAMMATQLAAFGQVKALVYWNETDFDPVGATELRPGDPSIQVLRDALGSAELKPPPVPG
ncbi:hypothetical protein FB561_4434 [Kribbella amoyensis]|uniref:GH26 domain-containing protein n=1 Tax=Kribbella amoyensis TaxID=996641 RepID=A0A561BWQ9_9ACTN|nr:hypothetical protein [Kribbella amoyensis]TWD83273.1 hypothetical protein FB561_4434 [Kribbella amoyensis]